MLLSRYSSRCTILGQLGVFIGLAFAINVTQLSASDDFLSVQRRIIEIFKNSKDGVVKVSAAFSSKDPDAKSVVFVGTGFYISTKGYVLTNTNVTFGADRVWVERDGVAYAAEQVGHDPLTNIAVIRTLAMPPNVELLRLSEMQEPPEIGSLLVALTCELGLDPGPSMGLVSGLDASYGDRILPTVYMRTDIPADGGEGGAPVFDLNGNLVGVMVVALPEIRSSFVLPARAVSRIVDDILHSGGVSYAYFGMQTRQIATLAQGAEVLVEYVAEGGPADMAGIKSGDVLKEIGAFSVSGDDDLREASFYLLPDRFVSVVVMREGEPKELSLKVGKREVPIAAMPPVQSDGEIPIELPSREEPSAKEPIGKDAPNSNPPIEAEDEAEV